jgi:hypothetical protein
MRDSIFRMKFSSFVYLFVQLALIQFIFISCNSTNENLSSVIGDIQKPAAASSTTVVNGPLGNSALTFSPATKNYGNLVTASGTSDQVFTVTNSSIYTVILQTATGTTTDFTEIASTCTNGTTLAPNQTCSVTLRFAPVNAGNLSTIYQIPYAENGGSTFSSSLNLTGAGTTLTSFAGLDSIDNVTGTTMRLNWTGVAGADSYQVYRVNGGTVSLLSSQVSASFCTGVTCNYTVTGLTPGTSYSFRVRATDTGGVQEANIVNRTDSTWGAATFSSISDLAASEGSNAQTGNLSCSNGHASTNAFSITAQSDSDTNCALTAATGATVKVSCTPNYKTGHSNWSGTVTVQCIIDNQTLSQTMNVNVSDTNRAPQIEFSTASTQAIAAGSAMTAIDARDSNTTNDTDRDNDSLTYSCTFSGGGFGAGTNCSSLPNLSYSLSAAGVLNWTPTIAAAVGGVQTTYTIIISASDGSLSGTATFSAVVNPAVVLNTLSDKVFPSTYASQGSPVTFDFNNIASGSATDTNMAYTCTFDVYVDGAVASGTNCTSLPSDSSISFNASTGAISWTPNIIAYGAYELKFTGTNTNSVSDSKIVVVDIYPPMTTSGLLAYWDSQFATGSGQGINSTFTSVFKDLTTSSTANDGDLNNFAETTSSGWTGNASRTVGGAGTGPYRVTFDGSNDTLQFPTFSSGLNANSSFMFDTWVRPSSVSTRGAIIVDNSDSSGKGVKIKQSYEGNGKLLAQIGANAYDDLVINNSPNVYWQLVENSGSTSVIDSSGNGVHGTKYGSGVFGNSASPFSSNSNLKSYRNATANAAGPVNYIESSTFSSLDGVTNATIEFWYYPTVGGGANWGILNIGDPLNSSNDIQVNQYNGVKPCLYIGATSVQDAGNLPSTNAWYHVVYIYDGSQTLNADRVKYYVNGVLRPTTISGTIPTSLPNNSGASKLRVGTSTTQNYDLVGNISNVAIYNSNLTTTDISNHYSARTNITCATSSSISSNNWYHLSSWWDNAITNFNFVLNGTNQCSVVATGTYSSSTNDLALGTSSSGAHAWSGDIGDFRIYSSGGFGESVKNFLTTGYRFGRPKEQPISNGLVMLFDAATANNNISPQTASSCTNTTWAGTSKNTNVTGTLTNFLTTDCSSAIDGWAGDGSTTSPYRVILDGTNDYVATTSFTTPNDFTLVGWVRRTTSNVADIFSGTSGSHLFRIGNTTTPTLALSNAGAPSQSTSSTTISNGVWYQVAVTRSTTNTDASCPTAPCVRFYVNGVKLGNTIADPLAGASMTLSEFGRRSTSADYMNGAIAINAYYNRELSAAELLSLCNTYASRFPSGQACAP